MFVRSSSGSSGGWRTKEGAVEDGGVQRTSVGVEAERLI
jgi:hypothetical protein